MGHCVNYIAVSKNSSRQAILDDIREEVMHNDWEEGGNYHENLKWHEKKIYRDKDEAFEAIRRFDNGWYSDHAVLFHDTDDLKKTAKITKLEERIANEKQKLNDYTLKNKIANRKSDTITCPHCHSRIALAYYRGFSDCPVCGTDMRSATVLERIDGYKKKIETLSKQLRDEKIKACEKAPVKWLVKYEYHM